MAIFITARISQTWLGLFFVALLGNMAANAGEAGACAASALKSAACHRIDNLIPGLPLLFEPNVGQWPERYSYASRSGGYVLGITERSVQIKLFAATTKLKSRVPTSTLYMEWIGGNPYPSVVAERRGRSVSNFFLGNDPRSWYTNVPNFERVRYEEIYPGIDWALYGNPQQLEYDFIVAANADVSALKFKVNGAKNLEIDGNGDLLIRLTGGTLRQLKPSIYQVARDGAPQKIDGGYKVQGNTLSFKIGSYDHSRALIIDPVLEYSTYIGGSGGENAAAIAADSSGNVYVAGETSSTDFPTAQALQSINHGNNAFVLKFNSAGNALIFATYLGGGVGEEARGIALDSAGNVYVTGETFSHDFPLANAYQPSNLTSGSGSAEGFVTKLNSAGDTLLYSTYLGGSATLNVPFGIAVDTAGSAYITGYTDSADFPTRNAFQATLRGRLNAFITKLSPAGDSLVYSSYLGGSAADEGYGIGLDSQSNAVVVGDTNSLDFPLVNPFQNINKASTGGRTTSTAFVSKVNSAGTQLLYSTYLGGSESDEAQAVAVDSEGAMYIAGQTCSQDFPVLNAYQPTNHSICATGGPNGFVTKLTAAGDALVYSTYLGGSGGGKGIIGDYVFGIALDAAKNVYAVGAASSVDFPTVAAIQPNNKGSSLGVGNAFISELNPGGNLLIFSTYLGGSGSYGNAQVRITVPQGDSAAAVALDPTGNIYVAGQTASSDFPVLASFQTQNKTTTAFGSATTAFVAKLKNELSAPLNLAGVPGSSQIVLSWSAVVGATSYNVYEGLSPDATQFSLVTSGLQSTSYTVTQLNSATAYYFQVSAVGSNGEGEKSSVLTSMTNNLNSSSGGGALSFSGIVSLLVLFLFTLPTSGGVSTKTVN